MMDEVKHDLGSVPLAGEFFDEILPRVQDLVELKLTLYVHYLAARRGTPGVSLDDLLTPSVLRSTVGLLSPEPAEERLRRGLNRAVANGSLLRVTARRDTRSSFYFLPATRQNQELIDRVRGSDPEAAERLNLSPDVEAVIYRPNVFAYYEQHIGPLTPLVAEQLRDAERSYPRAWIDEAILSAVHYNKRDWRYIQAILSRWEETGGP